MEAQQAFVEYDKRTIDDLQLYRRLGHDDPRAQQEVMAAYEARQMMAQASLPFWNRKLGEFFALTAGEDPTNMGQTQQASASVSAESGVGFTGSAAPPTNANGHTPQLVRPGVGPPAIAGPPSGTSPLSGQTGLGA